MHILQMSGDVTLLFADHLQDDSEPTLQVARFTIRLAEHLRGLAYITVGYDQQAHRAAAMTSLLRK